MPLDELINTQQEYNKMESHPNIYQRISNIMKDISTMVKAEAANQSKSEFLANISPLWPGASYY